MASGERAVKGVSACCRGTTCHRRIHSGDPWFSCFGVELAERWVAAMTSGVSLFNYRQDVLLLQMSYNSRSAA